MRSKYRPGGGPPPLQRGQGWQRSLAGVSQKRGRDIPNWEKTTGSGRKCRCVSAGKGQVQGPISKKLAGCPLEHSRI